MTAPSSRAAVALPPGFLIGCASAAHQVEGGLVNDWSRFAREHPEKIRDGSNAERACDHYSRFAGDLTDLAALHNRAHRFSVEWARIEPREGSFDAAALAHYRDVVSTCRRLGMEPVVTLHHFTLPLWLADRGGLLSPDAPRLFARYAAACATAFGDEVRWWVTVNEPAVLAYFSHLLGYWPPMNRSKRAWAIALRSLLRMHAAATRAVRRVAGARGRPALISIAHHERRLLAREGGSPLDRMAAVLPDHLFNRWFLRSCASGRVLPPLGVGERIAGLRGSLDYIGLNYYCEDAVAFDLRAGHTFYARAHPPPGLPLTSMGWTIDPPGLHRALVSLWQEFHLPLLVSENGVAGEGDESRAAFIVDHLAAVCAALGDGVDVLGYLYWTALDNFEWGEGYTQRFGLFEVDRETMERRAKPSAAVFAEICRTLHLPEASGDG